jgi:hypothetical protein
LKIEWPITGSAHHLKKSAPGLEETSIHRLFFGQMTLETFDPRWFVTVVVTLGRRWCCRVAS